MWNAHGKKKRTGNVSKTENGNEKGKSSADRKMKETGNALRT